MIDLFAPRGTRWYPLPSVADLIDADGDCWEWKGYAAAGYATLSIKKKHVKAYRLVWEALVGPIPEGLVIDHLCRNKMCVNPDHLEPVTQRENILRGHGPIAKHARKTVCKRGHAFNQTPVGRRRCLTCQTMRRHGLI